jgi:hypothetical protein
MRAVKRCAGRDGLPLAFDVSAAGRLVAVLAAVLPLSGLAAPVSAQSLAPADSSWLAGKGYHQRAGDALVHMTHVEISAARLASLAHVLRTSPRVEVERVAGGRLRAVLHAAPAADGERGSGCAPDVYVNGRRVVRRVDSRDVGVDQLVAMRELTAVEVYAADRAPVGLPQGCGAVLLWSRRLTDRTDDPFIGRISGQVTQSPEGARVGSVMVRVEPGGHRTVTGRDGRFDFAALPPGRYRVEVEAPNAPVWRSYVVVRSAATVELGVEIEVTAPVRAPDARFR